MTGVFAGLVLGAWLPSGLRAPSQLMRQRSSQAIMTSVFIDGEAGTTGLQVRERLEKRDDIELITLAAELRKDAAARAEAINSADAVILCLPDAAAIEAASLVTPDNQHTVLIDASTAHRINDEWAYGFPELNPAQRARIAGSKRIANPGCYATGFIAVAHPLVAAGAPMLTPPLRLLSQESPRQLPPRDCPYCTASHLHLRLLTLPRLSPPCLSPQTTPNPSAPVHCRAPRSRPLPLHLPTSTRHALLAPFTRPLPLHLHAMLFSLHPGLPP